MRVMFASAVMFALLCQSGTSQVIVDPSGAGDFRTIQDALTASPAGATVLVRPGSYAAVRVTKPVTIIGQGSVSVQCTPSIQDAAVTLAGPGFGNVTLQNLTIYSYGSPFRQVTEGMVGGGFSLLSMDSCNVSSSWSNNDGIMYGKAGAIISSATIRLSRCSFRGSDGATYNGSTSFPPDGGQGAVITGVLYASDCKFAGGWATAFYSVMGQPSQNPCPCTGRSGRGGDGLVCGTAYLSNCTTQQGVGASIFYKSGSSWIPWGQQPWGTPLVSASATQLTGLSQIDRATLGSGFMLQLLAERVGGAMVLGVPGDHYSWSIGHTFFDLSGPISAVPMLSTATSLVVSVPQLPDLLGRSLVLQHFDSTMYLSGPVWPVIGN